MALGSSQIGNLSVNLTMDTAAFQKGATIAEKRAAGLNKRVSALGGTFKTFAVGFAGGIAAGLVPAISGVVSSAFNMASALNEASQKVGVTVEALQELRLAATQNGISNEQLERSLARLNKSLGALQLGSKPAVDAFAQIGLSADELKGKAPDEAMRLIADALNRIPDASQRAAIGQQIFGRSYAQLIPLINGGSAELDKWAAKSRENGQISTENAKKLDELADSWDMLKQRAGVAIVKIGGSIAQGAIAMDNFIKSFWRTRDEAIASFHAMRDSVVASITGMVNGIANAITGRLSAIWNGAKEKIDQVTGWFKNMYDAVVGHSYIPDMVTRIGQEMGPRLLEAMAPASVAIDRTVTAFDEGTEIMVEGVKKTTGEIIEGFGQMAAGTISSVKSMVDTFKSGDILGGIQQFLQLVLNVVQALGQLGVIKLPTSTPPIAGARAHGGPVSAGKSYLVGERGPEVVTFGRKGFVHPNKSNNQQMRIQIVPSPLFEVVIDGRARNIAAPMAAQAAMVGASGGQAAQARSVRRRIP
jgi:hypothetical protein